MRTSIWYRTEEKQPDKSGYYLTYRGWGIGGKADGDSDHGYLYYFTKSGQWYEYESDTRSGFPRTAIVYYWTDAQPDEWTDEDPPSVKIKSLEESNPAVKLAWENAMEAIRQYEFIRNLTQ